MNKWNLGKVRGEDGKAATIAIGTVRTGPAGSNANVTNVGNSINAILDFDIPRGDQGNEGAYTAGNNVQISDGVISATDTTYAPATPSADGLMSKEDKVKLNGISTGATKNATDAQLRDRATHTGTQAISTVSGLQTALDSKVNKVAGMGLSSNDFTSALKDKLTGLEGTHWRGTFVSLAALQAGVTNPAAGDYADVDAAGADVERYIWDATDSVWVVQSGAVAPITASQVKQLYESNHDTNAFTDAEKGKLGGIQSGAQVNTVTSVNSRTGAVTGLVENTDGRLSDSREWSAATVSQAEAEAGTATTRRAWTAQRVRQAIVAWWNGITSTLGRTLVGRTTAADMRGDLGLGTAATRNVGTASGNVMEVNALGIGSSGSQGITAEDAKNPPWIFSRFIGSTLNKPVGLSWDGSGSFVKMPYDGPSRWAGILVGNIANGAAIARYRDGVIFWRELLHTGNIHTITGQSTQYPMTQKAVTDALNTKANTSTQVIAGAGLSGGGNLSANRTLSVNYGTTAGTAAQGNDSRIVNAVQTSGNQTIAGTKTFSSTIGGSISGNAATVTNGVYTTGNQTIAGTKTFSSFPVTPSAAPTSNYQVANKKYVDDKAGGGSIGVGQTWQDVRSQIINNTVRTNTTGRPIQVIISGGAGDLPAAEVYIDGIHAAEWAGQSQYHFLSITFTLPSGSSYKVVNIPDYDFVVLELR